MTDKTSYTFRFNLEGGKHIEIDLSQDKFEKLSQFCDSLFPEKNWKTEKLKAIQL